MVVFLAIIAALANAVASVCQRLGVEGGPLERGANLGLVRFMIRRRIWIFGFALMSLAYFSQAVALHLGSLYVVQPLMVSELIFVVIVLWVWYRTPLRTRDLFSAVATSAGLGTFLAVSSARSTPGSASPLKWFVVVVASVGVALVTMFFGLRGSSMRRALLLGAGASVGFSLVAAVTKSLTDVLAHGWGGLFTSWQLYVICVVGLGSFIVMQNAFQAGPFAASQAVLILVNPFVSLALGYVLFGENLRGGPSNVSLEVVSLIALVAGAIGLSSSPLVATVHDDSDDEHLLAGRGLYSRWRETRVSTQV